ncbi:MAG: hypothetical protein QOJ01_1742 [Solirubrobacterales bacterium]|nr:hypothetical protein [Solirubrobacterales bacterium]
MRGRFFASLIAFGVFATAAAAPSSAMASNRVLISSKRSGSDQIYLANADGSDFHRVSDGSHGDHLEGVTPDASRIVFSRGSGRHVTQYSMDLLGGDVQPFTTAPTTTSVSFSPTGDGIAYLGDDGELYRADANGGNAQALTTNPCAGDGFPDCPYPHWGSPTFSPNGRYLAATDEPHNFEGRGIAVFDLKGTDQTPRPWVSKGTRHSCCAFNDFLGFAPDSSAFIEIGSSPGGPTPKVLLQPTTGGPAMQLTPDGQTATGAEFLRDGRVVVFEHPDGSSRRSDTHAYVEQPNGSHRHRIRRGSLNGRVFNPGSDSPDGTKVLSATAALDQHGHVKSSAVYVSNPDGSDRVEITHSRGENRAIWVPDPAAGQSTR